MEEYIELHCHTNFSLLDGASHPDALVNRARELGMPALAVTDHDGLYGIIRFYKAAQEAGIKPIIGAEVTLDDGSHLSLLVKDKKGYSNLCRLISKAHLKCGKCEALVDSDNLSRHHEGLICLSGCRQGRVSRLLLEGKPDESFQAAGLLRDLFGREGFWIELQNHYLPDDAKLCGQLADIARRLDAGCVATNNVHYATQEGYRLHDILVCIRNRTTLDKSAGLRRPNSEYYLKTASEMSRLFRDYPRALANSVLIGDMCSMELDLSGFRIPDFPLPAEETSFSYLRRLCHEGARRKYRDHDPKVMQQLEHELEIIHRMHLAGYFLMVWDIMRFARERGIPAQGRGSAADSIVCYVLGITRVDPIRYNLLFERFLNEEMKGTPDIDIDVSTNHREELIRYVYGKYGQENTAMVCNVVTYRARNAVRDTGKVLGLPPLAIDRLAKSLERYSASRIEEEVVKLKELGEDIDGPLWQQFVAMCRQIADFPRHLSIHVGAMLATSCPLINIVPLEPATAEGRVVTQWDKDDIEELGLIKVDLLGLRMLSLIQEAVELIEEHRGIHLCLDDVPLDDPQVFEMLCEADTVGVFQIESRAQMQTLPKTRPQSLDDLVVEVAIVRPGPIQGKMIHPYIARRQGEEKVTYLHPSLKPILEETLGVTLFQEQIIRVAVEVAGFSPGRAEQLRRAMGKKRSREEMEKLREGFVEGARARSVSEAIANQIFDQLAAFSSFGFCKSHAAAFARTCYESAYLKVHFPAEFYCSLLNNQPMGFYSPEVIVNDAKRHGVVILPVDINLSRGRCTVEGERVRLGFRYVRDMGEYGIKKVEEERARGPFTSLRDFCRRTSLPRKAVENLILVGAMDSFGRPKRHLLWELGVIVQDKDFALSLEFEQYQPPLPDLTDMEHLAANYRVQGLSQRCHPMELLRKRIANRAIVRGCDLKKVPSGRRTSIAGCVVCRQRPGTAGGHVFLTLEDEDGLLNVVIKPDVYEKYRMVVRMEPLIVVEGVVQKKGELVNIIARKVYPLKQELDRADQEAPAPRSRNFC